jgi:hypothetical protein
VMAELIETAPKDRRILGFGRCGFESEEGWATVRWCKTYSVWWVDPNEATEYDPESCELTHWLPLPTKTPKGEAVQASPFAVP